jgi:hypothetical protein
LRHSRHLERLSLPQNADSSLSKWRSREGGPALLARAHRGRSGTLSGFQRQRFSGGLTGGATPDPISNSEVKTFRADGTAGETLWESRSPPGIILSPEPTISIVGSGLFYWLGWDRRSSAAEGGDLGHGPLRAGGPGGTEGLLELAPPPRCLRFARNSSSVSVCTSLLSAELWNWGRYQAESAALTFPSWRFCRRSSRWSEDRRGKCSTPSSGGRCAPSSARHRRASRRSSRR